MNKIIYPREILHDIEPHIHTPQAIIVTGVRRTGKTSLLHYIYNRLSSHNKLLLDLENPITRRLFEEDNYEMIRKNLEVQNLNFIHKSYIFLDEIQSLRQIASIVKYFIDHYQAKFFLTGSASFYLKNLFSESLAGRKFIFELFPLTFKEFLIFKQSTISLPKEKTISEVIWKTVNPFWQEYLSFGGFPEVVLAQSAQEKRHLLQDIFTSYFQKEIIQLADFRKIELLRNFIILLAQNIGNLLNIERMANELGVSRITLEEWLSFLKATYLVDLVPPYSHNIRVAIRKAKKIYFVDWALAQAITQVSAGQKLENCIFHLLRLKGNLNYLRKKSGVEIDFIVDKKSGFEVKSKANQFDFNHLKKIAKEFSLKKFNLVSDRFSSTQTVIPGFLI